MRARNIYLKNKFSPNHLTLEAKVAVVVAVAEVVIIIMIARACDEITINGGTESDISLPGKALLFSSTAQRVEVSSLDVGGSLDIVWIRH